MGAIEVVRVRVHLKTYGCTANQADSRRILTMVRGLGHTISSEVEADAVIVNTCTVTGQTERKVMREIDRLIGAGMDVIVAGCIPAAQPEELRDLDILGSVTPKSLDRIRRLLPDDGGVSARERERCSSEPIIPENAAVAPVEIATGCVGRCSYCIVKRARGDLHSRPIEEIVEEVSKLVASGVWEIQLTSQDTACYGWDTGSSLPELLSELSKVGGDFRIRIGMMNPATARSITDELIEAYRSEKVYKFLHLPVQSGSDKVLIDMRREYSVKDYQRISRRFTDNFPLGVVSTDFIVGYPTETDADFLKTLKLLQEMQPLKVNITRYSKRPHTDASRLQDLPERVKKERSRRLTEEHLRIAREILSRYRGEVCEVTVTTRGRDHTSIARDDNYRYIVIKERLPLGSRHRVKITGAKSTYLIGERVTRTT